MVNQISSERKVKRNFGTSKFECFEGPLGDVLRTSWGINLTGTESTSRESTFQGRPLNVRLGRLLDVSSGLIQDVKMGRHQEIRLGHPREGQIGYLWNALRTLEGDVLGTSTGPIFASWVSTKFQLKLTILIFRTKFVQKGYFQSKKEKSERQH